MRKVISGYIALSALAFCGMVSRTASADNAPAVEAKGYDILLNHTTPTDVIALLHWDEPKTRPAGLTSVTANNADNSLHIVATKEGLAEVEDLVSAVDVPARQILVNIVEALVPKFQVDRYGVARDGVTRLPGSKSDFLYKANGKVVAQMLADFTARGFVVGTPAITTTNNVLTRMTLAGKTANELAEVSSLTIIVSPRANADNTVTLPLKVAMGSGGQEQLFDVTRTVHDKEPFVAAYATPAATSLKDKLLLIFVTPQLLDTK